MEFHNTKIALINVKNKVPNNNKIRSVENEDYEVSGND